MLVPRHWLLKGLTAAFLFGCCSAQAIIAAPAGQSLARLRLIAQNQATGYYSGYGSSPPGYRQPVTQAPDSVHDQAVLNAAMHQSGIDGQRLQSEQAEVEQQIDVLQQAEQHALDYKPVAEQQLRTLQQGHFTVNSAQAKQMYVLRRWLNNERSMEGNIEDQIDQLKRRLTLLQLNQEDDQDAIKRTQQRLQEDRFQSGHIQSNLQSLYSSPNYNGYNSYGGYGRYGSSYSNGYGYGSNYNRYGSSYRQRY